MLILQGPSRCAKFVGNETFLSHFCGDIMPTGSKDWRKCLLCSANRSASSLFGFPRNSERAIMWAHALGRADLIKDGVHNLRNYVLCVKHFADWCFTNTTQQRLIRFAVPNMPEPPCNLVKTEDASEILDDDEPDESENTESHEESIDNKDILTTTPHILTAVSLATNEERLLRKRKEEDNHFVLPDEVDETSKFPRAETTDAKRNFSHFGEHIAYKLNTYSPLLASKVEFKISQLLYEADMEQFGLPSETSLDS